MQTLNNLTIVCTYSRLDNSLFESLMARFKISLMKVLQKVGDPMGAPRTCRPSVTSTGTRSPLTILVEYFSMVCFNEVPLMVCLSLLLPMSLSTIDDPEVEVRILVFLVFNIAPSGVANSTNLCRK